jgi:hypothetical protein
MEKPEEEQIRVRAHALWELAGKPDGRDDEFWHEAEKEIKSEKADMSVIAQRPEPMSFQDSVRRLNHIARLSRNDIHPVCRAADKKIIAAVEPSLMIRSIDNCRHAVADAS